MYYDTQVPTVGSAVFLLGVIPAQIRNDKKNLKKKFSAGIRKSMLMFERVKTQGVNFLS